ETAYEDRGKDCPCLTLTQDGNLEHESAYFTSGPQWLKGTNCTTGHVQWLPEGNTIVFFPGPPGRSRGLSEQESRDLLRSMLDQAQAGVEKEGRAAPPENPKRGRGTG